MAIATLQLHGLVPVKQGGNAYVTRLGIRDRRMYAAYSTVPHGKLDKIEVVWADPELLPRDQPWSIFEDADLIFMAQSQRVLEGL